MIVENDDDNDSGLNDYLTVNKCIISYAASIIDDLSQLQFKSRYYKFETLVGHFVYELLNMI